jgi:hypothetical protein
MHAHCPGGALGVPDRMAEGGQPQQTAQPYFQFNVRKLRADPCPGTRATGDDHASCLPEPREHLAYLCVPQIDGEPTFVDLHVDPLCEMALSRNRFWLALPLSQPGEHGEEEPSH